MALIDKASLLMVPSTYEAGKLYNVLPSGNRAPDNKGGAGYDQTRADFDFDRGSNAAATRIGSDGLLKKYRENLLTRSQDFGNSQWFLGANVSKTTGQTDPNGGNTAVLISNLSNPNGYFYSQVSLQANTINTFSIYIKGASAGSVSIRIDSNATGTRHDVNYTTEWTRVSCYQVVGQTNCEVVIGGFSTFIPGENIQFAFAQVESGLVATDYLNSTSVTAKAGVLIDLPRINYDANGENGALLLEPSRQQLLQFSEYFDSWGKNSNSSAQLADINSPEGLKNAYEFTYDGTSNGRIEQAVSVTNGTTYTFSIYLKNKDISDPTQVWIGFSANPFQGEYVTITNEWQRFETTQVANSTTEYPRINYDGAGTFYAYGAQIEAGSYVSSYIPNHGTSGGVTRAADSCNNGGSAESINSVEGVLYAEISALADDEINRHITLWDGTDTNRLVLKYDNQSNVVQVFNRVGGIETAFLGHSLADITILHKIAVRYKANDYALVIDGVQVDTDTSSSTWSVSVFNDVKFSNGSGSDFYGNVKQVALFKEALSDSELATLTTL